MDDSDQGGLASAKGIVRCLRMLTEEARSLGLQWTAQAIAEAVRTCQAEMGLSGVAGCAGLPRTMN